MRRKTTTTTRPVPPVSAWKLLQQERKRKQQHLCCCLLQHPALELTRGSITQLAGPAGTGKTQMALTLLCDCVLQNNGNNDNNNNNHNNQKKAVYISLGGGRNYLGTISKRLQTMLASRWIRNNNPPRSNTQQQQQQQQLLANIFLQWIPNSDELLDTLQTALPRLLNLHNPTISLVVLDGIANLFRLETNHQKRSNLFFQLSSRCKAISDQFKIPFLIVNAATTKIQNENNNPFGNSSSFLEPALGLSWAQCVNSTFFVTRQAGTTTTTTTTTIPTTTQSNQSTTITVPRRILRCVKSPQVPANAAIEFYIDCRGTVRIA